MTISDGNMNIQVIIQNPVGDVVSKLLQRKDDDMPHYCILSWRKTFDKEVTNN